MSALDQLDELIQTYTDVEDTDIPSSISQAVKDSWELTCDAIALQTTLEYTEDDRKADSQRVITLAALLGVLEDMEEGTVDILVKHPGTVVHDFVEGIKNLLPEAISNLVGLVVDLWNNKGWVPRMVRFGLSLLSMCNKILSAEQLAASIEQGLKSRDSWARAMRKAALPQKTDAPRFRGKKKTRRS